VGRHLKSLPLRGYVEGNLQLELFWERMNNTFRRFVPIDQRPKGIINGSLNASGAITVFNPAQIKVLWIQVLISAICMQPVFDYS